MALKTPSFIQVSHEKGVVLFIALIVLVAMSLAGVAMNRSVSASLGIAGNLAFRQSTLYGADKAVADAITWIEDNKNGNLFNSNQTTEGYTANITLTEPEWQNDTAWVGSKSAGTDAMGNTLDYRIDRLCSTSGIYTDTQCSLQVSSSTGGATGNSITAGAFQFQPPPYLNFRITARSRGPKNSTSIVQTYYLIPM